MKKYLFGDYHTHTSYSDGKNTIEENIKRAIEMGLQAIAITDHGPGHMFFGIKEREILEQRRKIDQLKEQYPEIDILLGIEGNILGVDGSIDATALVKENIDLLLVGYHFGSRPSRLFRDLKIHIYNFLQKEFKFFRKRAIELNTTQLVNAMHNNDIDILTHPGDKGPIDIKKVVEAAEATDTILEINEHHGHLTVEELKVAKKYDVKFIISSDSHHSEHIGTFTSSLERLKKAGIELHRVVNYKGE